MLTGSSTPTPQLSMWQVFAYVIPGTIAFCVVYWVLVSNRLVVHDTTSFFVAILPGSLFLGHLVAPLGVIYNHVFGRFFPHSFEHWFDLQKRVTSHTGLVNCTNESIYQLSSKIATFHAPSCTISADELLQMAWMARNSALVLFLSAIVIVIVDPTLWILSVLGLAAQPLLTYRYFQLLNRHKNHLFNTVLVVLRESGDDESEN